MAEPGEFTFRAFLAGKLDLTQAEGVAATISAVSDGQLEAATLLRAGRLGHLAAELVDQTADTWPWSKRALISRIRKTWFRSRPPRWTRNWQPSKLG